MSTCAKWTYLCDVEYAIRLSRCATGNRRTGHDRLLDAGHRLAIEHKSDSQMLSILCIQVCSLCEPRAISNFKRPASLDCIRSATTWPKKYDLWCWGPSGGYRRQRSGFSRRSGRQRLCGRNCSRRLRSWRWNGSICWQGSQSGQSHLDRPLNCGCPRLTGSNGSRNLSLDLSGWDFG